MRALRSRNKRRRRSPLLMIIGHDGSSVMSSVRVARHTRLIDVGPASNVAAGDSGVSSSPRAFGACQRASHAREFGVHTARPSNTHGEHVAKTIIHLWTIVRRRSELPLPPPRSTPLASLASTDVTSCKTRVRTQVERALFVARREAGVVRGHHRLVSLAFFAELMLNRATSFLFFPSTPGYSLVSLSRQKARANSAEANRPRDSVTLTVRR